MNKRALQTALTVAVLALGLGMLWWGGRGFVGSEPSRAVSHDEDGFCMCAPTLEEIAEEFGLGKAARKMACLAVAGVGLLLAGGSSLSLIARKGTSVTAQA